MFKIICLQPLGSLLPSLLLFAVLDKLFLRVVRVCACGTAVNKIFIATCTSMNLCMGQWAEDQNYVDIAPVKPHTKSQICIQSSFYRRKYGGILKCNVGMIWVLSTHLRNYGSYIVSTLR